MRIAEFQQLIRDRYHASDSARGVPGTFLWLAEEIGELASALADAERGKKDEENLAEEFADEFADAVVDATGKPQPRPGSGSPLLMRSVPYVVVGRLAPSNAYIHMINK